MYDTALEQEFNAFFIKKKQIKCLVIINKIQLKKIAYR